MPTQRYDLKDSYSGGNTGVLYTDRRNFYLSPNVVKELYPDATPFVSFLAGLKTVKAPDPDYKMFEHRGKWLEMSGYIRSAVDWDTSSWGSAISSINVTEATTGTTQIPFLTDGDIIEVRAGSGGTRDKGDGNSGTVDANDILAVARVTSVSSSSDEAVTLTPIEGENDGSETYNLADGDPFVVITRADEEGSGSPTSWHDDLETVWNSAQIQKTPLEITGTLLEMASLRGYSNELARLRMEKMKEHKMKNNRALLLGRRIGGNSAPTSHMTGSNGRLVRTTMGAIPLLDKYGTTDEQVFNRTWANYTVDSFIDDMEAVAQYDNAKLEKFAFGGSGVFAELSKTGPNSFFARSGGSVSLSEWKSTSFGFDVRTLTYPFGQLHLVWDPSMRYGHYKNTFCIFDPDNIMRVVYRPDKYETAIQNNDSDMIKDHYMSDHGLGMTMIEKSAKFKIN